MIPFYKYHGTGNDFILIDLRVNQHDFTTETIQRWCHRQFGVGADGVIALQRADNVDFEMKFWNNDGSRGMMCGNGGRCIVAFAHYMRIFEHRCTFLAPDGIHQAEVLQEDGRTKIVSLTMNCKGSAVQLRDNEYFINTGTPHVVTFVQRLAELDVEKQGRILRYDMRFSPHGTNANFVEEIADNQLYVRTYERGVESETLSCGTGVTAAVLSYLQRNRRAGSAATISVKTPGGRLSVVTQNGDNEIRLVGPAVAVYRGEMEE